MKPVDCCHEDDVLDALTSGRWPNRADDALRAHVASCAVCADLVDVAGAILEGRDDTVSDMRIPSSAVMWWRAQMRARQEAARLAEKPITIVHALSIAAGVGLMLSIAGYALAGVKGSWNWVSNLAQSATTAVGSPSVSLTSPWVALTLTTMLLSCVIASIAAYVIFSDE